ncbi:MAG: LON peptidase substrate-binding domain-containing protein, partial [Phycisphaerae bacterium]|nr:LON peptidase substrate-binding domain-containing protein [Phycisphaerae bacterium]
MDSETDRPMQEFWVRAEENPDQDTGIIKSGQAGESGPDQLEVPKELAILPIRNGVAFPGTVMPLTIGRERSKRLLDDILPETKVVGIFTQTDPQTEDPGFGDLHGVGCACVVLKLLKLPEGNLSIVVHGLTRVAIEEGLGTEPYHRAVVRVVENQVEPSKELDALILSVRETASKIINLSPHVPNEAGLVLDNITDPGALADFLAANVTAKLADKQELLEMTDVKRQFSKLAELMGRQVEV